MGCCASNPTPGDDQKSTQISQDNEENLESIVNPNNNGKSKTTTDKSEKQEMPSPQEENKNPNKKTEPQPPAKEEPSRSRSSSNSSSLSLSAKDNDRKSQFLEKIAMKKLELEAKNRSLQELQSTTLENQVSQQQAGSFVGLYQIFEKHATNANKTKMDIEGCTAALSTFGMLININKTLQRFVFSKFDLENEGEIDYNDFMATLSSLIGTKNEESLLLMFQIFDIDQDGYLNLDDMARVLLTQNQIAVTTTGQQDGGQRIIYSKKQCLKQARRMIAQYDSDQFRDDKISFDEFQEMMMKLDTKDMMIDNMVQPSLSIILSPNGAEIIQKTPTIDKTPTYSHPDGQIQGALDVISDT